MALPGSADDAVGARLSYFLNLTGPAIEVKTACSSSLVAINQGKLVTQRAIFLAESIRMGSMQFNSERRL